MSDSSNSPKMYSDRQGPSGRFLNLPFMRKKDHSKRELHLPFVGYLPNKIRNHFIAMAGEFVGTFLFLFFAFSATQVANAATAGERGGGSSQASDGGDGGISQAPNTASLSYIALAFGFSLAVNAWVFFRVSGGLFNPAVTLGMALIGSVGWIRASLIFISQILGSLAASGVVDGLFPGELSVSTTLGGGTTVVQGLFIEMFLTSQLVITIFLLAAEKHKGTFLAPIGIGLSLFIAELSGVFFTGGSLNPARSFGPCVVLGTFPPYHWIYWVGPILGAMLAVIFYRVIKMLEYETANPGQDFNAHEADAFSFDEENAATASDVLPPTGDVMRMKSNFSGSDQLHGDGDRMDTSIADMIARSQRSNSLNRTLSAGPEYVADHPNVVATATHGAAPAPATTQAFHAGPDAEKGTLGGDYTVSGLRHAS